MKASKDFRMKSTTKTLLALGKFKSEEDRASFRRAMVQAQLAEEKASRDNQRGKPKDE
jgi:hypothetical protein